MLHLFSSKCICSYLSNFETLFCHINLNALLQGSLPIGSLLESTWFETIKLLKYVTLPPLEKGFHLLFANKRGHWLGFSSLQLLILVEYYGKKSLHSRMI